MARQNYSWICVATVALILLGKTVIGGMIANGAMVNLAHAIVQTGRPAYLAGFPLSDVLQNDPASVDSVKWFKIASVINPSQSAWWGLGRAGLATGDYSAAATAMEEYVAARETLPQAELDAVLALSLDGRFQELTALYERLKPESRSIVLSDTVALAYLEQAKPMIEIGQELVAAPLLTQAVKLRPTDLYANFYLYKISIVQHDAATTLIVRQRLMDLRGASIHPTDKRLVNFVVDVVPHLYESGIWSQATVQTVIAYLVWQHTDAPELESLLNDLIRQEPDEPGYKFYLGELYQRLGKWQLARVAYQQTLNIDSRYDVAKWRLGLVCQQHEGCPENQAVSWYAQYLDTHPGDLLALTKFAELCSKAAVLLTDENCHRFAPRVGQLLTNRVWQVSSLQRVATALGIASGSIFLGPDLIEENQSDMFPQGHLGGWIVSDEIVNDTSFRSNSFVSGPDKLDMDSKSPIRIMGLLRDRVSMPEAPFMSWYGIWAWDDTSHQLKTQSTISGQWYLIQVTYRTPTSGDEVYLRLNADAQYRLTATNGEWHRYLGLFCGAALTNEITPFVYVPIPSSEVLIDDVSIQSINAPMPIMHPCGATTLVDQ